MIATETQMIVAVIAFVLLLMVCGCANDQWNRNG